MFVSNLCEFFNIKNYQGRVCDGLAEHYLGIGPECPGDLLRGRIAVHKSNVDAHLFHGHGEEVEGPAVDGRRADEMVAGRADIEDGVERGGLSGGGEHSGHAAREGGAFGRYGRTAAPSARWFRI